MEKNQKQIVKVLKDMGYNPEIDSDGDIYICLEVMRVIKTLYRRKYKELSK